MERAPRRVEVEVPGHVHVGNPDLSGDYGRLYGTLGIAVEEPHVLVEAGPGEGCECGRPDALAAYERAARMLRCRARVRVLSEIPAHVGLGSTTALYLGIARALAAACGKPEFDPVRWALQLGRGTVSALGVYTFMYGGIIFDAGFRAERRGREVPPLLFRADPPGWLRIVIALPERPIPRVLRLKEREDEILERLPRMDPSFADRVSRMLLMGVLGNIASGDWEEAGRYITMFNRILGQYWSREQEGVYCCEESSTIISEMLEMGALFAGQSSWGPAVYGAFRASQAREAAKRIGRILEKIGGGRVWVTRPAVRGARVTVEW